MGGNTSRHRRSSRFRNSVGAHKCHNHRKIPAHSRLHHWESDTHHKHYCPQATSEIYCYIFVFLESNFSLRMSNEYLDFSFKKAKPFIIMSINFDRFENILVAYCVKYNQRIILNVPFSEFVFCCYSSYQETKTTC